VGWILLGGVAYLVLDRLRASSEPGGTATDTEITPEAED
jgi:hypothetical protein